MIKYEKLLKRISIKELETIIGKSAVKTIKEEKYIRFKTLEKICKHLKCQPDDVISFK